MEKVYRENSTPATFLSFRSLTSAKNRIGQSGKLCSNLNQENTSELKA
jgi:hypothetical protein